MAVVRDGRDETFSSMSDPEGQPELNHLGSAERETLESLDHSATKYSLNKMVLCRHFDSFYYEAKIVALQRNELGHRLFKVHYQGWNRRHDELISEKEADSRFLPYTKENCEKARARLKVAQEVLKSKRKAKKCMKTDEMREGFESFATHNKKVSCKQSCSALIEKDRNTPNACRSKKRFSENSSLMRSSEEPASQVSVEIPLHLKNIIIEDQSQILDSQLLVRLPARFTVDYIISRYINLRLHDASQDGGSFFNDMEENEEQKSLINDTLKDLFNLMLGTQLLYKFEMLQYSDLVKSNANDAKLLRNAVSKSKDAKSFDVNEWRPSKTYGFIHLLRFFVKLDCLAKSMTSFSSILKLKRRSQRCMIDHLHSFLEFLNDSRDDFYDRDRDYMEVSQDYLMRINDEVSV